MLHQKLTKYEIDKKNADFELRRRLMTPIKKEQPTLILPGTIEREHMVSPFRPSSRNPDIIGHHIGNSSKPSCQTEVKEVVFTTNPSIYDSETGEEITFTSSKWSSKEGSQVWPHLSYETLISMS